MFYVQRSLRASATLLLLFLHHSTSYLSYYDFGQQKCFYGERGSLTATCMSATSRFFRLTPYKFDHLDETLQCWNCNLATIEQNTFDLPGNYIQNLILKNAQIKIVSPKAFVGLVFLKNLDLSNNNIDTINPGTFTGVKKIITLNLRNNTFLKLQKNGLSELVNLQTLILSNNEIVDIDNGSFIGLEHSLSLLRLDHNKISNITGVFSNLTTLQYVDLSYNSISQFSPFDFDNMTALTGLNFAHNDIHLIPNQEFSRINSLQTLDFSYNDIGKLEVGAFHGLHALETLDLSHNKINLIPQKMFQQLYSLIKLNLTSNKLQTFDIGKYSGLPHLNSLNLSYNLINNIETSGIFPISSLYTLDLSNNNLSDLNYVSLLHRLPHISYFALENNNWPCYLEDEMASYFDEDNFKFVLFSDKNGYEKCNQTEKNTEHDSTNPMAHQLVTESNSSSSSNVFLFVLLAGFCILLVICFYVQYRLFKELNVNPFSISTRTRSEVQLISSDLEARDNE